MRPQWIANFIYGPYIYISTFSDYLLKYILTYLLTYLTPPTTTEPLALPESDKVGLPVAQDIHKQLRPERREGDSHGGPGEVTRVVLRGGLFLSSHWSCNYFFELVTFSSRFLQLLSALFLKFSFPKIYRLLHLLSEYRDLLAT